MLTQHYPRHYWQRHTETTGAGWSRWLRQLVKRIGQYPEVVRQRRQLLEMDERMLQDIGLSRSDADRLTAAHWFRSLL